MELIQILWIVLIVVFIAVEAATIGLTSIWFAAGALVALLVSFVNAPEWLQILLFFVVSVATLLITRPLAAKYINSKVEATNADRVIGGIASITERIDNIAGTGTASVGGRVWTARSRDGHIIEAGEQAIITSIEGVKLIVVPIPAHAEQMKA